MLSFHLVPLKVTAPFANTFVGHKSKRKFVVKRKSLPERESIPAVKEATFQKVLHKPN